MIVPAIVFALVLGVVLFAVLPRARPWQRAAGAATFVVLIAAVYGGSVESLSRPKPWRLEWRTTAKAKVLAASLQEGKGIYLWLQVDGAAEPRAYVLPWSVPAAQQLQTALQKARDTGTEVRMTIPRPRADATPDDRAPKFYAVPQPPLPDKNYADDTDTVVLQRPKE